MGETGPLSAEKALAALDESWYTRAKLRSKRRDMLGAFVGTELFFLEGDSLIQRVLNDPLIALGQAGDCSLQLLHAYYAFERIITDFTERGANFQIVFFENSRHLTIGTGALSSREIAIRSLIRTILIGHALRLLPTTCVFSSPTDPMYTDRLHIQKPMLLCVSDGGMLQDHLGSSCADSILIQRGLLRDALAHHLAIGLLDAVEFKDSKIMTFVYESHRGSGSHNRQKETHPTIPTEVWDSVVEAEYHLAELENQTDFLSDFTFPGDRDAWLVQAAQAYLQHVDAGDPLSQPVLHAFLAHIVLLTNLDVTDRSLGPCFLDPALANYVRTEFYPIMLSFLGAHLTKVTFRPDLDGRVFEHLLHAIVEGHELSSLLGPLAAAELDAIWTNLGQRASAYAPLSAQFSPVKARNSVTQVAGLPRLLPLANDVVADMLRDIDSAAEIGDDRDDEAGTQSSGITQSFLLRDTHVWPKGRSTVPSHHIGPHVPKPATERLRQRKLRNDQRFMKQLQRQAETLTGAKGARLQQQVIAPVGTSKHSSNKPREKAPVQQKSGGKKGQVPLKSADKLRQQIKQAKEVKVQSEAETWWKAQLAEISKLIPSAQITHLDGLKRNKKADELWLAAEIAVYRLHLVCTQWIADDNREDPETSDRYRVSLLAQIRDLSTMEGLTNTIRGTMSSILQAIGFSKLELPNDTAADVADRAYQFKFVKIMSKSKGTPLFSFFPIQEHPTEYQLRQFGEYMDRSMDSQPDPRTQFDPDAWQRQVLDKIDQEESILVVAPTSAGKTFIGFYAMERVLRESDSGILIYVAPTKALVTQIAAEVYARFKKDLGGKSCWAVHTRELQLHNPAETQILITIPEMLSNMLLTPALARVWTPRIRRIIFDEIHSISEAEGGAVWEQLILMAPCPIIGLSATVGNPDDFNRWLESVQKAHGYKHSLILHPHRYSHLRKFVWNARAGSSSVFTGLAKKIPGNRLVFIHPISALEFRTQEIPSDLSLESRDCLSLYRAMKACAGPEQQDELVPLDPIVFFEKRSTRFFRQKDVLEYEEALKSKLRGWMSNPGGHKPGSPARRVIASLSEIRSTPSDFWMDGDEKNEDLVKLLSDLHHQDDLPAILFSFDRYKSETLAKALLAKLEEAEAAYRETSPIWKQKMQEWERWQAGAKAREKDAARGKKKPTRKGSDDEGGDAEPERGSSAPAPPSLTNPDDPTPEFTFTSFKGYTREELAQDLDQLSWKDIAPWLMDCLKRGIAVHHSGMNKAYRSLIEGLFRIGFIRVMISSETLALGINAPARTTVFLGDSPDLTALMYRQCAGRAGRRGFDLLGKVVFFGVPLDKIQRLMLSRLPPLTGQFPLSTTLSLRLFNVLDGSDNAPAARDAVRGILGLARLSVSSKTGEAEMRHHFRFSVDYLRRSKLLDEAGKTLLLTNLAAPLHENEPGNLALVALLRAGYFHKLSANLDSNRQQTPREFVLVLSHLFSRRYMRKISNAEAKELIGNAASVVVLPPLPREAKRVLESHNQRIFKIFSNYTVAYAKQSSTVLDVDRSLPLSGELPKPVTAPEDIPIIELLRRRAVPVVSRSVFVANSGHGDNFASIEDLDRTTRPGLHLNKSVIPYIQLASESAPFSLNALLYDFYVHGSDDTLVAINGIGRGEVWYILNDFFLVLVQLQTNIEQLFRQAIKDANADAEGGDTFELPSLDDDLEDRREYFASKEGVQGVSEAFPQRPPSIPEGDWDVYRVVAAVRGEFETKFKAMWA